MSRGPRLPRLGVLLSLGLLFVALWVLDRELSLHSWVEIQGDLASLPRGALTAAILLTLLNYAVLAGYDALSVRYAEVAIPFRRVALASTLGYALSQALGFPLLTGAPVRIRLYGRWGIDGAPIAKIIAFSSLTFWVGIFGIGGALLASTTPLAGPLPAPVVRGVGISMLLGLAVYIALSVRQRPALRVASLELRPPKLPLVAAQLAVTGADWLVAAAVLFVALPDGLGIGLLPFTAAFVAARVLGTVSNVPGGLGVFEATLLTLLPDSGSQSALFASLVVYRIVYYILPLALACAVLVALEVYERRHRAELVLSAVASVVPTALAALVFVLGASLLVLGSTPLPATRLEWLSAWLHPAALNVSHFLASVGGAGMILLARGIQRRLRGAYYLALPGLAAMTVISLTAFAAPLLCVAFGLATILLWAARDRFYRPTSLLDQAFTPRWIGAIGVAVAASVWLGLFAFKDVAYSGDLWWRFTLNADAPRFLRGAVGTASVLLFVSLSRLLRATPHAADPAPPADLDEVAAIVRGAPRASANLALLGDKSILFSPSRRSFLMYGVRGSSWIAMGDPVGETSEFEALLWEFGEQADAAGDITVFYQVAPEYLHLYVDLGMSLFNVGEEGRVPLADFTLEGKRWADLRQARSKFERLGAEFLVLPPESVNDALPALRAISDEWLTTKNAREKSFSLGRFDEAYLLRNPVAILRVEGQIVAFASLWVGDSRNEFSADLMRYGSVAPNGAMDCLFANLLLWGNQQGFGYLGLGMAPLSGLDGRRLAPLWHRLGDALFDHGERFYNFRGLYDFKEKFDPVWEPRYLAVRSARHLPLALADVAALIGGGFKGVLSK